MKFVTVILATILSFSSIAAELTTQQQHELIEQVAKNKRRNFWRDGYENVSSKIERISTKAFETYTAREFESNLKADAEQRIKECLVLKICEVFLITISSEYYSGYGVEGHFVLLDTASAKYDASISHSIYAE